MSTLPAIPTSVLSQSYQNYTPDTVDTYTFAQDPAVATANLTRAQWADYQARFQPIENYLMQQTSYANPSIVSQEVGAGTTDVNNSYGAMSGVRQRALERTGVQQDAQTLQSEQRQMGVSKSAAVVDSANRIRQNIIERNQQIAIGGIPNAGRAYSLSTSNG